jgi:hypothetical protein
MPHKPAATWTGLDFYGGNMCKLTVPTKAAGRIPEYLRRGQWKKLKPERYHILKRDGISVCNIPYPASTGWEFDEKDISEIPSEKMCKKCLGGMKAED